MLALAAQAAGLARQDPKESTAPPAASEPAAPVKLDYAGSEACAGCHEDITKSFAKNPHFNLEKNKHWTGKACEACHGMGSKHADSASAEDIVNPREADRSEDRCDLSSLPPQPGDARRANSKRTLAKRHCLHLLPRHAQDGRGEFFCPLEA